MERIGKGSKPSKENGVTVQLKELSPSHPQMLQHLPRLYLLAYISSSAHVCLVDDMAGQCNMICVCSKAAHKQLATEDPEKHTLCMQQHAPVKVKINMGMLPPQVCFIIMGKRYLIFSGRRIM